MSVPVLPRYHRAAAIQLEPLPDTDSLDPFAPDGTISNVAGTLYQISGGEWSLWGGDGGRPYVVETKTASFVDDGADVYLVYNSADVTAELPDASQNPSGTMRVIKKTSNNAFTVTVVTIGETIDDQDYYILEAYMDSVTVVSDGTLWSVI